MSQFLIFLQLLLFFQLSKAANVSQIEFELEKSFNELMKQELKLANMISTCNRVAEAANKNLNASNLPNNFLESFSDFVTIARNIQMILNFEKFVKCGLQVCDCEIYQISQLGFQIAKVENLMKFTVENSTKFYESRSRIFYNFMLNFRTLQNIWTKEFLVLTFFNRSSTILNEFGNYFGLLGVVRTFLINMKDFLTSDVAILKCQVVNSNFKSNGDKIDDNLRSFEQKLLNLTLIAWDKVNISLNTVSSARKVSSSAAQKFPLQELSDTFKKTSTVDDHSPKLKWPHIPDTSGASFAKMRIRTCQEKKTSFGFTSRSASENQTEIQNNLDDLNAVSKVTSKNIENKSRNVRSTSTDILDVVNATINVINFYNLYLDELKVAISKVDEISQRTSFAGCSNVIDIFTDSVYLKTSCRQAASSNEVAQTNCQSFGMKLYQVKNYDEYIGIMSTAFAAYGLSTGAAFLIGGLKASNGSWFAEDRPIFSSAVPKNTAGRCMSVSVGGTNINFNSINCSSGANTFCELFKSFPVNRVPVTTNCRNLTTIQDSGSVYLKSACIIGSSGINDVARSICRMYGMNLFKIRTADDFNAVKTFVSASFTTVQQIYVDGRLEGGVWKFESGTLFSGAIPASVTGPCLILSPNGTTGISCGASYRVLCEFV